MGFLKRGKKKTEIFFLLKNLRFLFQAFLNAEKKKAVAKKEGKKDFLKKTPENSHKKEPILQGKSEKKNVKIFLQFSSLKTCYFL